MGNALKIPVIDLFAGPGGLGEGFSSYSYKNSNPFKIALSIENESNAHSTLKLRAFFRSLDSENRDGYYAFLRGEVDLTELYSSFPEEANNADEEAWCATLGKTEENEVDSLISKRLDGIKNWVLIGGPPCQAYSLAGRSRNRGISDYVPEQDKRHYLYREYLRVISVHRPAIFVMENVKGLLSSNVGGVKLFEYMLSDFSGITGTLKESGIKYRIHSLVVDAFNQSLLPEYHITKDPRDFVVKSEQYGIPQARHRIILLGIREDLGDNAPNVLKPVEPSMRPTVADVINGLPALRSGLSRQPDSPDNWLKTLSEFKSIEEEFPTSFNSELQHKIFEVLQKVEVPEMDRGKDFIGVSPSFSHVSNPFLKKELENWYLDPMMGGICNSTTRGHIKSDIHRYLYASCFTALFNRTPKLHEFPDKLMPNHRNRHSGHFSDRFRVQLFDRPASTITSHISKDGHYFIHPDPVQCRSLTVREAARIQTFPDNYYFTGNRTQQYVQVGNAVPPLLAKKIAKIVYEFMTESECTN